MSRDIRKARRRITAQTQSWEDPRHRHHGQYVFYSGVDCIVAKSYDEARDFLCLQLWDKPYEDLPQSEKNVCEEIGLHTIGLDESISFFANQQPNWEPEDEDEQDDPPRMAYTAREIINYFGEGVVFYES